MSSNYTYYFFIQTSFVSSVTCEMPYASVLYCGYYSSYTLTPAFPLSCFWWQAGCQRLTGTLTVNEWSVAILQYNHCYQKRLTKAVRLNTQTNMQTITARSMCLPSDRQHQPVCTTEFCYTLFHERRNISIGPLCVHRYACEAGLGLDGDARLRVRSSIGLIEVCLPSWNGLTVSYPYNSVSTVQFAYSRVYILTRTGTYI